MKSGFHIDTPRLSLRPWREEDRSAFAALASDPDMMRYVSGGKPWTDSEVDAFFGRQARNLQERGYCVGAVTLRGHADVIGVAGLQPQVLAGDDELAWWIAREWQQRGFATEIGGACLRYGLDVLGRKRIVAIADAENLASLRVMEKIGMRYLDTVSAQSLEARYPDAPVARYVSVG